MTSDPGVRSVRVAVALCERFAELLKGPSTVTARKQQGALFGVSGNQDDLSLRIGEVQQIYPEIWRHLDDARTTFAGRGVDVSAYDAIRAAEGNALGAAVDVKTKVHGYGNHAMHEHVKSANFNREGHARAKQACDALMRATPTIDWVAIAKAEAEDPSIKAFTSATRTKRWIMFGLLFALIAAPFAYVGRSCMKKKHEIAQHEEDYRAANKPYEPPRLADADLRELEKAIAEARQKIDPALQAWPAATSPEALAAIKPGPSPCEFPFEAPTAEAAASFIKYQNFDPGFGRPFTSYKPDIQIPDHELRAGAQTIEGVADAVNRRIGVKAELLSRLKKVPTNVVFIVIDKLVQPSVGGGQYTPGSVAGRGYVYSVAAKTIVCTAAIDITNDAKPPETGRADEKQNMLGRELEVKIRQALAANLRAI